MLHIPHHNAVAVEILPTDTDDFLLPPSREYRKRNDPLHRDGVGSSRLHQAEVFQDTVKLCQRWSSFPLSSLRGYAKLLSDNESVFHYLLLERISPRRPRHSEDRSKVRQIVANGLRRDLERLREANNVGACDLAAFHFRNIERLDGAQ